MNFRYWLSVAGIRLLLETDHPLLENEAFGPFMISETEPDVHAVFRAASQLPPVPNRPAAVEPSYRIATDGKGNLQKFFFENPEDPVHYAVATYSADSRTVSVEYLAQYRRCVSEVQNCFFHLGFEAILLQHSKLCLHASCIDTQAGGILFSGVSGIGKSTQADLWCAHRNARQINGDRPILSKESRGWLAWGSPYAGSSKCYVNDSCAISAIVLLKQAPVCEIRKLMPMEAFRRIWAGLTVRSWDASFVEKASSLAIELASEIPVYELSCTPDVRAIECLEQELRKEYDL